MASIPLAEIPGVPALAAPVLGDGIRARASAQGLLSDTVSPGAFDGPGQGAEELGRAVGTLARVPDELSARISEAHAAIDVTKAETTMEDWVSQKRADLLTKPESEWEKSFSDDLPKLQNQLDKISPSPMAAQRIGLDYMKTVGRARVNIRWDAIQSSIEKGRGLIFSGFGRFMSEGNLEQAEDILNRGVAGHLISPAEKEARMTAAHEQHRGALVMQTIAKDPFGTEKELQEAEKSGKSDLFPWLTNPVEISNAARQARSAMISAKHDLSDAVDTGIVQGNITTPEQIQKLGEGKLSTVEIAEHIKGLKEFRATTPEGRAELENNRTNARAVVEKYDPSKDFEDEQYFKIKDSIRSTLPVGERDEFLDPLKSKRSAFIDGRKPKATSPAMSDALDQLNWSLENNVLGTWKTQKKGKTVVDDEARLKSAQRKSAIQTDMLGWAKENPSDAQVPEKVYGRLNSLLQEDREIHRAKKAGSGSTWWNPFTWGSKATTPRAPTKMPPAAEMLKKLNGDSASAPTIVAPATFYSLGKKVGGADETEDTWTNRGFSSMGENLTPGIVAVNDSKYPIGTIFKDPATGEAFVAADRHGNSDANVIDFYVPPNSYQRKKENRSLQIVGHVADVPDTAEGVRKLLSKFGKIPAGESAYETLKGSTVAKN